MKLRLVAGFACLVIQATGLPALAAPMKATLTPSVAAYVGQCPATIKFTAEITGDPLANLKYQFGRVVGGTPTLLPWVSATIPATGKLTVVDTVVVPAPKAGSVSDTIRVVPGPLSVTATTSVTCVNPNATPTPTPSPKVNINPAVVGAAPIFK